jgi:anti-sigma regulatory factor (Ser/Thr protein kinase)
VTPEASVGERAWSMVVPHDARGARMARQRLAAELDGLLPTGMLNDVVAVIAELLGNAVRHARSLPGGVIRVSWRIGPDPSGLGPYVRMSVTDGGAADGVGALPSQRTAGPDSVDGRGLAIVAALTRRWGVDPEGDGQCVWADLGPTET